MDFKAIRERVGVIVTCTYLIGCRSETPEPAANPRSVSAAQPTSVSDFVGFEPALLSLGRQPWGSEHPFEPVFCNKSDRAIVIRDVQSSCGCTGIDSAVYKGQIVAPASELRMSAVLHIGDKPGDVNSNISVITDEGITFSYHVHAEAYATFRFDPPVLLFDGVDLTDVRDDLVKTILFSSESAKVRTRTHSDSSWIETGVHRRVTGETEIAVHILKRNLAHGQNIGRITIPLDDPRHPSWTLPVTVNASAPLRAVPSHVFLHGAASAEAFCLDADGLGAQISRAESDDAGLSVEILDDKVRVLRKSGVAGEEAAVVWLTDARGRRAKLLVSTILQ